MSITLRVPDLDGLRQLPDSRVLELQRSLAALRRQIDAASATVAGEIGRRSHRDAGHDGLAQRVGARTPERLVAILTGMSAPESSAMVTVGAAIADEKPWLSAVASQVASGELGVAAAAAISRGLGEPDDVVDSDALAREATKLADSARSLTPEKVAQRARRSRDELDDDRVADREAALRGRRYLRLLPLDDGMTRISGLLDPESAALVTDALDRVTMPRRGGVRFVDPAERARSAAIESDSRTTEQLALDAFVHMIRVAAATDDGRIFGVKAPAVRVHARLADLQRGTGAAHVEGQTSGLSIGSVHRMICVHGVVPILFDDDGRAMNVGRTQRLFTERQRIGIAARDGGCIIPGCDRPPSWTEAHHIDEWDAHGGRTDIDDGVSLCRHHHMWVHDGGRRIVRSGATYSLCEPDGSATSLPSKHPLSNAA
ncbi:MAG: DUF222 domain-containing protein [Pseudolysinimonas sp.]